MKYILILAILFLSCTVETRRTLDNSGIPRSFKTLEFWNGGALMSKFKNVSVEIEVVTSKSPINSNDVISFFKYHIFDLTQNIDEWILDSEALAIKYTLPSHE